jgi:hypothetical protein
MVYRHSVARILLEANDYNILDGKIGGAMRRIQS